MLSSVVKKPLEGRETGITEVEVMLPLIWPFWAYVHCIRVDPMYGWDYWMVEILPAT